MELTPQFFTVAGLMTRLTTAAEGAVAAFDIHQAMHPDQLTDQDQLTVAITELRAALAAMTQTYEELRKH